ncbi:PhnB protein [Methylobacterium sp. OAE515]|uniref:glyoxalase superfamily protein n=1 Tax=Methylobacterium sp. OAE515 TaxID=2817895 RepID=UPI00178AA59E
MKANDPKAMAKALRKALREQHIELPHSACLESVARQCGHANWNVLAGRSEQTARLTATIFVDHGRENEAASFYETAFGASQRTEHMLGGKLYGVDLLIGEQEFTVAGANPNRAAKPLSGGPFAPTAVGNVSALLRLEVGDAERTLKAAIEAGPTLRDSLQTALSGERAAAVFDPFGHIWGIIQRASPKRLSAA